MSELSFDSIRPLKDSEVPDAVKRLQAGVPWLDVLEPWIGNEAAQAVSSQMGRITTVDQFQAEITQPVLNQILEKTTDGVSYFFSEEFKAEGALFVSNHRDIVLDPSLINLGLKSRGAPTTEIGIGSNLLGISWVKDLVRLNKSFIVERGGSPRDQLMQSAETAAYVRHVVGRGDSVWLAQREGRAKDGNDRTSPALMRMLVGSEGREGWEQLNVQPVAINYEWDPCDAYKVHELLVREQTGGYEKSPGEDEANMKGGLLGTKGRIEVYFGSAIPWTEGKKRPFVALAGAVNDVIHRNMRVWAHQVWAARQLRDDWASDYAEWLRSDASIFKTLESWCPDWQSSETEAEKRLDEIQSRLAIYGHSARDIQRTWCEMTAYPLRNKWSAYNATEAAMAAFNDSAPPPGIV